MTASRFLPVPAGSAHASGMPAERRAGYTLLEVMIAMTILLVATTITLGAYVATLKRAVHAEQVLEGTMELRHATELISDAVRSAPLIPVVQSSGRQLLVAPKDLGYATVLETTWIDSLHGVKGSKANQRMLKVSNVAATIVSRSVFVSDARPASTVSAGDVATYFPAAGSLPTIDLNDLFTSGDTITIPATNYGAKTSRVINNISNNSGNKTLTVTADLGVDVPNGTKILASGGRRIGFVVGTDGTLRYYPDMRDTTKSVVLASDIDPAPLSNPANRASARTTPFSLSDRYLTINLQRLPAGSVAGRTLQGVRTTVYARTDPLSP